jgi:hypothetical protein
MRRSTQSKTRRKYKHSCKPVKEFDIIRDCDMRCDLKGFLGYLTKESLKIASHVAIPNEVYLPRVYLHWALRSHLPGLTRTEVNKPGRRKAQSRKMTDALVRVSRPALKPYFYYINNK